MRTEIIIEGGRKATGTEMMGWAPALLLGAVASAAAFSPQPMLSARGEIRCCSKRGLFQCSRRAPAGAAPVLLPFARSSRQRKSSLERGFRCQAASSASSEETSTVTRPQEREIDQVRVRLAEPGDMKKAMELSMETFYGLPSIDLGMSPLALFMEYRNPRGEPYRAYEFLTTGLQVRRRLSTSLGGDSKSAKPGDRCAVFVAEKQGKMCGMVELIELQYPAHPGPNAPYLFNLCVSVEHRRQGIGRMLVERCERQAVEWGEDKVFLHVEHDDVRQIYSQMNFVPTHSEPTWFQLNVLGKPVVEHGDGKNGGWSIMLKDNLRL